MGRLLVAALLIAPLAAVSAPVEAAITRTPKNVGISVSTTGAAGDYDSGGIADSAANRNEVTLSASGRFVAFHSYAGNLTTDDTNNRVSVFVRDRDLDADGVFDEGGQVRTVLVSQGTDGESEYGEGSMSPYISRDGRFVAFESYEALVPEDTNEAGDVYVRDRDTDRDGLYDEPGSVSTTRVSVGPSGEQGNNSSMEPVITPDGRYVVFSSIAATLVPEDAESSKDVYLRDRDTDADGVLDEPGAVDTTLVTHLPGSEEDWKTNEFPTITPDGRFLVWQSTAQGWVPGDANRAADIYLRDRDADGDGVYDEGVDLTTTRLSIGLAGADADHESQEPAISDSGRFVTFSSQASNLVKNDTNGARDIFVVDRDRDKDGIFDEVGTTSTKRVSVSTTGQQADGRSVGPTISADGRVIVFESSATNLDLHGGLWDVYLRDRDADRDKVYDEKRASITTVISLNKRNGPPDGSSFTPFISANRRWVAFSSFAENLVKGQVDNNRTDVFVRGPLG